MTGTVRKLEDLIEFPVNCQGAGRRTVDVAANAALISEDQCVALVQASNSFCPAAAGQRLRETSASYHVPAVPDDHTLLDIPSDHFAE